MVAPCILPSQPFKRWAVSATWRIFTNACNAAYDAITTKINAPSYLFSYPHGKDLLSRPCCVVPFSMKWSVPATAVCAKKITSMICTLLDSSCWWSIKPSMSPSKSWFFIQNAEILVDFLITTWKNHARLVDRLSANKCIQTSKCE